MEGTPPVPLSLAEALAGLQAEDPRTPKKISLDGEDGCAVADPGRSPGSVAATTAADSEAAQSTPQKVDVPTEVADWATCGPPPGLPDFHMALGSHAAASPTEVPDGKALGGGGGIMGTTPLTDLAACGMPFFEAYGTPSSVFGTPCSGPSPCSPYALFGPEYFPDAMRPAMGEAEQFMSLFQGLLHETPPTAATPEGSTDTFQLLATMAEETADPILAALAATSPLRRREAEDGHAAGVLVDAPPGLPMPSRQSAAGCPGKAASEALPPGLEGWTSDDSTASPAASDGPDAPSGASCSDSALASPASENFTMSPEAMPFVPSSVGLVTAPLDPLAVLATAPPALAVPAVAAQEAEDDVEEVKHGAGSCRPCAWFWKAFGCSIGKDCEYCHECPKGALKARKKVKRAMIRLGQAPSPGVQEALTPTPGSPNFVLSLSALL